MTTLVSLFGVCLVLLPLLSSGVEGAWVPAKFTITSDNAYAVYSGDANGITYLGSDYASLASQIFSQIEYYPVGPLGKYDPTPAANPLYLDVTHSVYIVAWSDAAVYQGILFDFVINGVQISPNNPQWQVFPSNIWPQPGTLGHPPTPTPACSPVQPPPFDRAVQFGQDATAPPCPTWVQQQVAFADTNNLWQVPTRGSTNDATSLYNTGVAGIPQPNKWMWFNSTMCANSADMPFDNPTNSRCHHMEPLIFRIPSTAFEVDPDACSPRGNPQTHTKFCAGQCPFRPDGTAPRCASIFTDTGSLRACECCQPCDVVVMPNLLENYCTGYCPNAGCQQCQANAWGQTDPSDPSSPHYIKGCGCSPINFEGRCTVDRCNNRCVGQCPTSNIPCVPTNVTSSGQILECACDDREPCRLVDSPTGELQCTGTCITADTPCKGFYVNGKLKACSCDCCELVRQDDPRQNYCAGKCDNPRLRCDVTEREIIRNSDGTVSTIATGCGCFA